MASSYPAAQQQISQVEQLTITSQAQPPEYYTQLSSTQVGVQQNVMLGSQPTFIGGPQPVVLQSHPLGLVGQPTNTSQGVGMVGQPMLLTPMPLIPMGSQATYSTTQPVVIFTQSGGMQPIPTVTGVLSSSSQSSVATPTIIATSVNAPSTSTIQQTDVTLVPQPPLVSSQTGIVPQNLMIPSNSATGIGQPVAAQVMVQSGLQQSPLMPSIGSQSGLLTPVPSSQNLGDQLPTVSNQKVIDNQSIENSVLTTSHISPVVVPAQLSNVTTVSTISSISLSGQLVSGGDISSDLVAQSVSSAIIVDGTTTKASATLQSQPTVVTALPGAVSSVPTIPPQQNMTPLAVSSDISQVPCFYQPPSGIPPYNQSFSARPSVFPYMIPDTSYVLMNSYSHCYPVPPMLLPYRYLNPSPPFYYPNAQYCPVIHSPTLLPHGFQPEYSNFLYAHASHLNCNSSEFHAMPRYVISNSNEAHTRPSITTCYSKPICSSNAMSQWSENINSDFGDYSTWPLSNARHNPLTETIMKGKLSAPPRPENYISKESHSNLSSPRRLSRKDSLSSNSGLSVCSDEYDLRSSLLLSKIGKQVSFDDSADDDISPITEQNLQFPSKLNITQQNLPFNHHKNKRSSSFCYPKQSKRLTVSLPVIQPMSTTCYINIHNNYNSYARSSLAKPTSVICCQPASIKSYNTVMLSHDIPLAPPPSPAIMNPLGLAGLACCLLSQRSADKSSPEASRAATVAPEKARADGSPVGRVSVADLTTYSFYHACIYQQL